MLCILLIKYHPLDRSTTHNNQTDSTRNATTSGLALPLQEAHHLLPNDMFLVLLLHNLLVHVQQAAGVPLTLKELDDVFTFFDRDRSDTVSFPEFLAGVKPAPSEGRIALIKQAFAALDSTGDGRVTIEDMRDRYLPIRIWHEFNALSKV